MRIPARSAVPPALWGCWQDTPRTGRGGGRTLCRRAREAGGPGCWWWLCGQRLWGWRCPLCGPSEKPDVANGKDRLPSYWVAGTRELSPQFLTTSTATRCLFLMRENLTTVPVGNRRAYKRVRPSGRCGAATSHTDSGTPTRFWRVFERIRKCSWSEAGEAAEYVPRHTAGRKRERCLSVLLMTVDTGFLIFHGWHVFYSRNK